MIISTTYYIIQVPMVSYQYDIRIMNQDYNPTMLVL